MQLYHPGLYGSSCYHTIWERIKDRGSIRLQDIYPHWHYYRLLEAAVQPCSIQVLDPMVIRGEGIPKGALGKGKKQSESSTKRLSSAFELPPSTVLAAVDLSAIPKEQVYICESTTRKAITRLEQGHKINIRQEQLANEDMCEQFHHYGRMIIWSCQ